MAAFKKVIPIDPTSYLSPFSRLSNQRIVTLTFNLFRSSKVKFMGTLYILSPLGPTS